MQNLVGQTCRYRLINERDSKAGVIVKIEDFENFEGNKYSLATMDNGDVTELLGCYFLKSSTDKPTAKPTESEKNNAFGYPTLTCPQCKMVPLDVAERLYFSALHLRDFISMQPKNSPVIWIGDRKSRVIDMSHFKSSSDFVDNFERLYLSAKQS